MARYSVLKVGEEPDPNAAWKNPGIWVRLGLTLLVAAFLAYMFWSGRVNETLFWSFLAWMTGQWFPSPFQGSQRATPNVLVDSGQVARMVRYGDTMEKAVRSAPRQSRRVP